MNCTFFGHADCTDSITDKLSEQIEMLILNSNVDTFYVGNNGNFDRIAVVTLKKLKKKYPHINVYVVLAYLHTDNSYERDENTIYPDGAELVLPRFAIDFRNKWMIKHSDYVVSYVRRVSGGAVKYRNESEKRGKTVIDL